MKPNIILMNFTHVYEQERFINDIHFQWIDCTDRQIRQRRIRYKHNNEATQQRWLHTD